MQDPLSDVIHAASITGAVFLKANFTAPWAIYSQVTPEDCAPFLDIPAHVIAYHLVIEGSLFVEIEGNSPIEVSTGEIILLPKNSMHILSSKPGVSPTEADELIIPAEGDQLAQINYGGGGEATTIYCGFLASDISRNPLFDSLPDFIKLDITQDITKDWIEASVQLAAKQLIKGELASSSMMSRLSELLLTEAVRTYSQQRSDIDGWIMGLTDKKIGRALALIHGQLNEPWSNDLLANEVAMSRSAFVDKFTSLVGTPPIRYLMLSRLQSAKSLLQETNQTLAEISHQIGYESAVAFNRAFKREVGIPPAQWRSRHRQHTQSGSE
ncbi:AraC family transcriptional regulator [Candidatus Thiodiazotropha sp. CDECU1]|uniref:AraC family transcriptional regulator n=1 Tax=Candidatus Thiodiazotropha sp. CDECU1 TaxID=3065865 RepID=UPI00292D2DBD|nr:AraC family transcriptional regulator [Candidatus Thiodiazotropha sp. CDECU1]